MPSQNFILDVSAQEFKSHLHSFDLIVIYFLFPVLRQLSVARAFSVASPILWNSLSVSVKSVGNMTTFCHKLKTLPV